MGNVTFQITSEHKQNQENISAFRWHTLLRTGVRSNRTFNFFLKNKEFSTSVYILSYNTGVRINGNGHFNSGKAEYTSRALKVSRWAGAFMKGNLPPAMILKIISRIGNVNKLS